MHELWQYCVLICVLYYIPVRYPNPLTTSFLKRCTHTNTYLCCWAGGVGCRTQPVSRWHFSDCTRCTAASGARAARRLAPAHRPWWCDAVGGLGDVVGACFFLLGYHIRRVRVYERTLFVLDLVAMRVIMYVAAVVTRIKHCSISPGANCDQ